MIYKLINSIFILVVIIMTNIIFGTANREGVFSNENNKVIFGTLFLSSSKIYTSDNPKYILKDFKPFFHLTNVKILVKTKIKYITDNCYAIIRLNEKNIGNVIKYFPITISDSELLYQLSICHWNLKQKFTLLNIHQDRQIITNDIFSIDPENCTDIDDALHISKINNYIEIGIHISDVSSYISQDVFLELQNRISSLYFDKTIHMFPDNIMKEMSLTSDKQKRAFSILILFDETLTIQNVQFVKSIIHVKNNLSYNNVNSFVDNLYNFALLLNNKYNYYEKYDIHNMVAIYMLIANNLVASKIASYDSKNVLLRRQLEKTTNKKLINTFNDILIDKHNMYQNESAEYIIGTENAYHSNLNMNLYTHMTSPLRRYVDIIVHTQLNNVLCSEPLFTNFDINQINKINKYYKHLYSYYKTINISEINQIYKAYIVNIEFNYFAIYIPDLKLDTFVIPIHYELLSIYEIIFDNTKCIIKHNNKINEYKLFDIILVNILKINNKIILSLVNC